VLLADAFCEAIFDDRECSSIKLMSRGLAMDWTKCKQNVGKENLTDIDLIKLKNPYLIGVSLSELNRVLFNLKNPLTKWLLLVKDACKKGTDGLEFDQFERTFDVLKNFLQYTSLHTEDATQCLMVWQKVAGLPSELRPPFTELKDDMIIAIAKRYSEYPRFMRKARMLHRRK
jgi:hypothetical protein